MGHILPDNTVEKIISKQENWTEVEFDIDKVLQEKNQIKIAALLQ